MDWGAFWVRMQAQIPVTAGLNEICVKAEFCKKTVYPKVSRLGYTVVHHTVFPTYPPGCSRRTDYRRALFFLERASSFRIFFIDSFTFLFFRSDGFSK